MFLYQKTKDWLIHKEKKIIPVVLPGGQSNVKVLASGQGRARPSIRVVHMDLELGDKGKQSGNQPLLLQQTLRQPSFSLPSVSVFCMVQSGTLSGEGTEPGGAVLLHLRQDRVKVIGVKHPIITVLMDLSTNPNICLHPKSILTDFFSLLIF